MDLNMSVVRPRWWKRQWQGGGEGRGGGGGGGGGGGVEEEVLNDGIDGKDGDRWEVELNIFQLQEFMLTSVNFLMADLITTN